MLKLVLLAEEITHSGTILINGGGGTRVTSPPCHANGRCTSFTQYRTEEKKKKFYLSFQQDIL